jgi:hypothetical protein
MLIELGRAYNRECAAVYNEDLDAPASSKKRLRLVHWLRTSPAVAALLEGRTP